jgi:hypothetical protein
LRTAIRAGLGLAIISIIAGSIYLLIKWLIETIGGQALLLISIVLLGWLFRKIKDILLDSSILLETADSIFLKALLRNLFGGVQNLLLKPDNELRRLTYTGEAKIPRSVRRDDSEEIFVKLELLLQNEPTGQPCEVQRSEDGELRGFAIETDSSPEQYLVLELNAPNVKVSGENPKNQLLTLPKLFYSWKCQFLQPGNHLISLIIRREHPTTGTHQIGEVFYKIKVSRLTARQVQLFQLLNSLIGLVSGVIGIIDFLSK